MTKENIHTQFVDWVKKQSNKDPDTLHALVKACLDDAVEQTHGGITPAHANDPSKSEDIMKQVLDYWSGNVFMIIERGIVSDQFRNVKMPIPNDAKAKALQEFHSIRNECYAKFFNF